MIAGRVLLDLGNRKVRALPREHPLTVCNEAGLASAVRHCRVKAGGRGATPSIARSAHRLLVQH